MCRRSVTAVSDRNTQIHLNPCLFAASLCVDSWSNSHTCKGLKKKKKKKSVALGRFRFASAALPHLTWGFMLLSSRLKLYSHSLSDQQILVIMSDATEKRCWLICYSGRMETFLSSALEKSFPCVVACLTFERRFCSGGLCFLTSGRGIFRCWLWIISCNDGSAWHVCLDSMPSSWNTDQTELSYWLQIETGISTSRFIHAHRRTQK